SREARAAGRRPRAGGEYFGFLGRRVDPREPGQGSSGETGASRKDRKEGAGPARSSHHRVEPRPRACAAGPKRRGACGVCRRDQKFGGSKLPSLYREALASRADLELKMNRLKEAIDDYKAAVEVAQTAARGLSGQPEKDFIKA